MNKHAIALSALALLATAPAFANQQLAQQKNCMSCHAVDKKIVGPSYKDVAAKYKNDPKAEAMLVQKVMKGGAGVWGPVPMPANNISEADAKTLVKWVMSQK
ncbi:c-type cytochrome [Laribacter hongkongensis]|uniref:Cytochrome c biogenesis protein CcsA n=1 Tax=Laribacter hongkongensis TaxID=168471 RepID=A0A248LDL2_9NEIS|nr:c-type cytochrome [Laribacter hongkongensis]ASJ22868.1 cytochrome c biogenesis protein CcsA [Laribacter hongkongensis]MCG9040607.1 c-type cytochrome [Laribacter hongkongensis]MCG9067757.1 c-type cytochrome [Laribacter hongkongensis]MCG9089667.1 c-type cytochrome [Laribacter hongkongensis]MCG9097290.1 c-type cytochrome [Laribacter hongkongensis]